MTQFILRPRIGGRRNPPSIYFCMPSDKEAPNTSFNFLTNPSPPARSPFIASVPFLFYHFQLPFYSVSPASFPVSPGLVLSDAKVGRRA